MFFENPVVLNLRICIIVIIIVITYLISIPKFRCYLNSSFNIVFTQQKKEQCQTVYQKKI